MSFRLSSTRFIATTLFIAGCAGNPRPTHSAQPSATSDETLRPCTGAVPEPPKRKAPKQLIQGRHLGPVVRVTFSKSGLLASASEDGSARIWDPMTRLGLAVLRDPARLGLRSVEWLEEGRLLGVSSSTGWRAFTVDGDAHGPRFDDAGYGDVQRVAGGGPVGFVGWISGSGSWFDQRGKLGGNLIVPKGLGIAPTRLAVSADGRAAAAVGERKLLIWSLAEPASPPRSIDVPERAWAVALSPRADLAVVATLDFTKKQTPPPATYAVIDTREQSPAPPRPLDGQSSFANALAISPDGRYVAGAANDGVLVWELASGKLAHRTETGHWSRSFTALDFSVDGRWLAVGTSDGAILVVETSSGRLHGELGAEPRWLLADPVFRGSDELVSANDGGVTRWSLATGAVTERRDLPEGALAVFASRTQGAVFATKAPRGCGIVHEAVHLIDASGQAVGGGKPLCLEFGERIADYDADSQQLLTVGTGSDGQGEIYVRELVSATRRRLAVPTRMGQPRFAAGGRRVLHVGYLGPATVWDQRDGKELARFGVPGRFVGENVECSHLAAMPDSGDFVATSCVGEISLRKLDGAELFRMRASDEAQQVGVSALAFLPGSSDLLVGRSDGVLLAYRDGKQIGHAGSPGGSIVRLVARADGRRIASMSADGGLRVWNTAPLELLTTLVEFRDDEHIAFTPEGAYAGTAEVSTRVGWVFDNPFEYFGFEQFARTYRRPDLVARRLSGDKAELAELFRRPPTLEILEPASDGAGALKRLQLRVKSDTRVDAVRLFVEGRPVATQAVCAAETTFEMTAPLHAGLNKVTAVAFDDAGFASNAASRDFPGPAGGARPELYVVAVGVSKYSKLGDSFQLAVADADALALGKTLSAHAGPGKTYADDHVAVLVNERVTTQSVERALGMLAKMRPEDVAVVAFAGHGVKPTPESNMVFLTSEVQSGSNGLPTRASVEQKGIGWNAIGAALGRARGRVLLLLDACQSGHVSQDLIVQNQDLALELSRGNRAGAIVFAASKGRQLSYENSGRSYESIGTRGLILTAETKGDVTVTGSGHGYFTGAILNSLASPATDRDRDGSIQVSELIDAVSGRVNRATRGKQTPWVARREIFGDFQLVRVEGAPAH